MFTTTPIDSQFRSTAEALEIFNGKGIEVTVLTNGTFTVSFYDVDDALSAAAKAKDAHWSAYLRHGGNPRNKRAVGSQFAGVTKAIRNAVSS